MIKKVLGFISFVALFLFPTHVLAYDYEINSYDVIMNVNENNVYDITENIGVYFNYSRHGIYRTLPLKNEVVRLDGTKSYNRVKISNIYVNEPYTESTTVSNGTPYKKLQIGDAYRTITGQKDYTIQYSYNIGKDTGKDYDEFYYNIIGPEWEDTKIDNISFEINMPKEFDKSKLGFSVGSVGSTSSKNVEYTVDGNTIRGIYFGTLYSGQALTIRLELEDGYFVGASSNLDLMMLLSLILPLIFVVIGFYLWFRYGRDEKVIDTVEFYPPKNFNSAEIGYMYKGKVEDDDIVSLIVYLANKGYLKISEIEEKVLFSSRKSFKLTKLIKYYDGNNEIERTFFDGLFLINDEVTESDLKDSFYVTLNDIKRQMNTKENRSTIFEKYSLSKNWYFILMMVLTAFIITAKPVSEFSGTESVFIAILFPGLAFTIFYGTVLNRQNPLFTKIFMTIWGLGFGGLPWLALVLPALLVDPIYLIIYFVGVACIIALITLLKAMPKRTKYGREILGQIEGFKHFLEVAEKPQLEQLVMQNPTYFYDILPYTYVLGVSDKWINKFETISYQAPSWYDSSDAFSMASFGAFMSSTMSSASTAMTSSPHSSSSGGDSGGSSGGGSSGGGSGGGGGGSW